MVSTQEANKAPWIVYPELYNSLGAGGPIAESFIANLTDLYSGSPVPMTEGTRTWGDVVIEKYILNWLAGTTESWLKSRCRRGHPQWLFRPDRDDRRLVQRLLVRGVIPAEL